MDNQIVVFMLSTESYGIEIALVESIVKVQRITPIPQAPDFIEGITNLRGTVLPVIDLRKRFGYSSDEIGKDSRIIVVNINGVKSGLIVDEVSEVLTIPESCVEPPSTVMTSIDLSFISGIAKLDQRLIILLDLSRMGIQDTSPNLLAEG